MFLFFREQGTGCVNPGTCSMGQWSKYAEDASMLRVALMSITLRSGNRGSRPLSAIKKTFLVHVLLLLREQGTGCVNPGTCSMWQWLKYAETASMFWVALMSITLRSGNRGSRPLSATKQNVSGAYFLIIEGIWYRMREAGHVQYGAVVDVCVTPRCFG